MPRSCSPPGPAFHAPRCGGGRSGRSWRCAHGDGGPFLVSAAPGAGKTRPALVLARELLRAGAVRRVAVVCPTTPLTRQWAAGRRPARRAPRARRAGAAPAAGLRRRRRHLRPRGERGGALGAPVRGRARSSSPTRPTTSARSWPGARASRAPSATPGAGCCCPARRFAATRRRSRACATTPTASPCRTSPTPTPTRCATGSAGRSRSSPTTACCSGAAATTSSRRRSSDALAGRDAARRYRTAISTELARRPAADPGAPPTSGCSAVRAGGHRDAGGLVVAADGEHARAIAEGAARRHGRARRSSSCTPRRARRRSSRRSRARASRGSSP